MLHHWDFSIAASRLVRNNGFLANVILSDRSKRRISFQARRTRQYEERDASLRSA